MVVDMSVDSHYDASSAERRGFCWHGLGFFLLPNQGMEVL
jgi:hypothetical protein